MLTLYKVDNLNKLRIWEICTIENGLEISHGPDDGGRIYHTEYITKGLASRSLEQQVESRYSSRVNKQLDRGYRYTEEEARAHVSLNSLNLHHPMLAQKYDSKKSVNTHGAKVQPKLDGNRLLVTRSNGELHMYTRNGKTVDTLTHLVDGLDALEEGMTIDGEIYIHGMPLKDINSLIRKKQSKTADLEYHVYDLIESDVFAVRSAMLQGMQLGDSIVKVPTWEYNPSTFKLELDHYRDKGYEGLMLRLSGYGYHTGKRSKSLLKVKVRHDAEYEVIGVELTKEDLGKFVFSLPDGSTFTSVAPGTRSAKRHVADNPDEYIGKVYTVSFAYLTAFGKPFHAVVEREFTGY